MGCFQHLRALPKPLGNRGLLQADQTDLAGLRLSRAHKAGYPLTALVSIIDVSASAFSSVAFTVAA